MCQKNSLNVDVRENFLLKISKKLLEILLQDKSTGRNIIWATDNYQDLGSGYTANDEITLEAITGEHGDVIRPRALKSKEEQGLRTRNMAEVFTPLWICNKMNNLADNAWFGKENVFNRENANEWQIINEKILFPTEKGEKSWRGYLSSKRLEITCGEAPYLASRYDTLTGAMIPIGQRIGLLDRKLRVLNERVRNLKDKERAKKRWVELAKIVMQSIYGYEWAGDNVLLARENLLYTLNDYYEAKFAESLSIDALEAFAEIISWNIWQMDGLKAVVPNSCHEYKKERQAVSPNLFLERDFSARTLKRSMSFCDVDENELQKCQGCLKDNINLHNGVYCKIKNWSTGKVLLFKDLLDDEGSEGKMAKDFKFDVVIGNPPYQEDSQNTSDRPIYDKFMSESYKIGNLVELITPARFLFNAGKTPKEWNKSMLEDEHLKVVFYEPDSQKVFPPPSDIKGGVAVTIRNLYSVVEPIGIFTPYEKLNSILHKVRRNCQNSLADIVYPTNRFDLDNLYIDYPHLKQIISSDGKEKRLTSSAFSKLDCFSNEQKDNNDLKFIGVVSNKRIYKYLSEKYVATRHPNLMKYKVILPSSNGSGTFGEKLSNPLVLEPRIGYTQTFISFGKYDNGLEALNNLKYIKTKFCRTMLGVLKVTQDNKTDTWMFVPLQDFTPESDIDWSKSIHEIDLQLYKKYGLSDDEIKFIETNVKEME